MSPPWAWPPWWSRGSSTSSRRSKNRGATVLLIEQNANMALKIADLGYVLETGRITLTGSGRDLLKNEDVKKAYLGT